MHLRDPQPPSFSTPSRSIRMIPNKYIDKQRPSMLFFPVFATIHPRRSLNFFTDLTPLPYPLSPIPCPLKLFRINTCMGVKSVSKQTTLTPFRMNTHEKQGRETDFAQFWCSVSPFRINTYKSVHSKGLYLPLESTLMKNRPGGGVWSTRNPIRLPVLSVPIRSESSIANRPEVPTCSERTSLAIRRGIRMTNNNGC